MKRCPQCEFIYEDDQSHCDMDGAQLAHDEHQLPKLQALTTRPPVQKPKARSRILAMVTTLVLAGVMALVYYVSIRQPSRTTAVSISPSVHAAEPAAEGSPATTSDVPPETPANDGSAKAPAEVPADNSASKLRTSAVTVPDAQKPAEKPSAKVDQDRTTKPTTRNTSQASATTTKPEEKDDSKVKSAIKKTGRFFKKALPF